MEDTLVVCKNVETGDYYAVMDENRPVHTDERAEFLLQILKEDDDKNNSEYIYKKIKLDF